MWGGGRTSGEVSGWDDYKEGVRWEELVQASRSGQHP